MHAMTTAGSRRLKWLMVGTLCAIAVGQIAVMLLIWHLSNSVKRVEQRQHQLQMEVNALKEKTMPDGVESINREGTP